MMKMLVFVGTVVVCALMAASASAVPIHASCQLRWTFSLNCSTVSQKLVNQMKAWNMSTEAYCKSTGTEKCLYDFKSATDTEIKATHSTPVKMYVDDLTFNLNMTGSGGCMVKGYSTSETWYAVLDSGTNYCNLRNLADGSGLSKSVGFKEDTSDSICTQYSSENCDKY